MSLNCSSYYPCRQIRLDLYYSAHKVVAEPSCEVLFLHSPMLTLLFRKRRRSFQIALA
nr:MAG TPA: hypothetical protein [Caudoviricetes sp.]